MVRVLVLALYLFQNSFNAGDDVRLDASHKKSRFAFGKFLKSLAGYNITISLHARVPPSSFLLPTSSTPFISYSSCQKDERVSLIPDRISKRIYRVPKANDFCPMQTLRRNIVYLASHWSPGNFLPSL